MGWKTSILFDSSLGFRLSLGARGRIVWVCVRLQVIGGLRAFSEGNGSFVMRRLRFCEFFRRSDCR